MRRPSGWRAWGTPHSVRLVGLRPACTLAAVGAVTFGVAAVLVRVARLRVRVYRVLNQVPPGVAAVLTPLSKLFLPLGIAVAVLCGVTCGVVRTRTLWPVALCGGAAALAWACAHVAKSLADRTRPYEAVSGAVLRQQPAHGSSFPSSHTAVAFAVAIAAIPYLPRLGALVALVYAALVACSRVFLGVHYPLDVLAGLGLGLAVGGAALLVARRVHRSRPEPESVPTPPSARRRRPT